MPDRDGQGRGERDPDGPARYGSGTPDGIGRRNGYAHPDGHGRGGHDRIRYDPAEDRPDAYARPYTPDEGDGRAGYDRDDYDEDDRARTGHPGEEYDEGGRGRAGFGLAGHVRNDDGYDEYDTVEYDRDGFAPDDYDYDSADYEPSDYDPSEYDPEPWPAGHPSPATTRLRRRRAAHPDDDPYPDEIDEIDEAEPTAVRRRRRAVPVRTRRRRWPWVIGGVALLVVVAVIAAFTVLGGTPEPAAPAVASLDPSGSSTGNGSAPAPGGDAAPLPAGAQVTYEVTGAGTARTITFGRGTGVTQVSDAPLPWQQVQPVVQGTAEYTITAQTGGGSGEISCRITVDGAVIAEDRRGGDYAAVSCTGRR